MTEERRHYERFTLDQCVTLSFGREDFIDAQGINLSRGGLLFSSTARLEAYQKLFVMINVPGGTFKAEGLVIHSNPEGNKTVYGVKFTDISEDDERILEGYCASIASDSV